jgi:hypothetical protein
MSTVSASIDLDCPPENVWKLIMDPARFNEWVTIHRKICDADDGPVREGFKVEQRMALRGAPFTVHWTLTELRRAQGRHLGGQGPGRLLRACDQQAGSQRQRRHALRVREHVRGAGRRDGAARVARCWSAGCPSARPTSRSRSSRSCSRAERAGERRLAPSTSSRTISAAGFTSWISAAD